MGLSPETGGPANAYPPIRPGEKNMPFWGTSFSAAYVSGVAALVRAKYPALSAHQIINRILQTAHNPPRGVDNQVGYGVVDPVAALTFDVPAGDTASTRGREPDRPSGPTAAATGSPRPRRGIGIRRSSAGRRRGGLADRSGTARAMTAATKLTIIVAVFVAAVVGWAVGGYPVRQQVW